MGVSSWKFSSLFLKFLWDERIVFSPAVLGMLLARSESGFQLQTSNHWGFCATAPKELRAGVHGVQKDVSWFTRFAGLSPVFFRWDLSQEENINQEIPMVCSPSAGRRQSGGILHTILHIIISRSDILLLNCWIKEKPKTSFFFFPLMQQCYKWKHVNEFPS